MISSSQTFVHCESSLFRRWWHESLSEWESTLSRHEFCKVMHMRQCGIVSRTFWNRSESLHGSIHMVFRTVSVCVYIFCSLCMAHRYRWTCIEHIQKAKKKKYRWFYLSRIKNTSFVFSRQYFFNIICGVGQTFVPHTIEHICQILLILESNTFCIQIMPGPIIGANAASTW